MQHTPPADVVQDLARDVATMRRYVTLRYWTCLLYTSDSADE